MTSTSFKARCSSDLSERSEEVTDGELEHERVLTRLLVERDAPLEAQRTDRREPAEAEADALAEAVRERIWQPEARVELDRDRRVLALQARAVAILEVVRVAHVIEHDAGDPDLLEQRELDLAVEDDLHVAAERQDPERLADVPRRLGQELRAERPGRVAADVVDAADQVALADRHAERIGRGGHAELGVEMEDERPPQLAVVTDEPAPANELVLRSGVLARVLGEHRVVPALGREQAVVARVPLQRRAQR